MIKIENLTKRFDKVEAVKDLNLEIPKGEIFGFLGPNGAGKTTTIRLLSGIIKPTSGRVSIAGYDIEEAPQEAKQRIGLLPDRPFIYPKLTGREFVDFVTRVYNLDIDEREEKISEYFNMFEIKEWEDVLIENYSHGMQQKLLLISIFIRQPEVVLMDEPMVGLDPRSARILKKMIGRFAKNGVTFFISTHTLEIAEKICQRIGIINHGELVTVGTEEELREKIKAEGDLENIFIRLIHPEEYEKLFVDED